MGRPLISREEKRSLRVEMSAADFDLLEQAAALFGVGKSDLVRRLVRASVEVGPPLSTEGVAQFDDLAGQVRIVGRNLMQVLRAIHRGEAVGIAESEPVWLGLHELIAALDAELSSLGEATIRQSAPCVSGLDCRVPSLPAPSLGPQQNEWNTLSRLRPLAVDCGECGFGCAHWQRAQSWCQLAGHPGFGCWFISPWADHHRRSRRRATSQTPGRRSAGWTAA